MDQNKQEDAKSATAGEVDAAASGNSEVTAEEIKETTPKISYDDFSKVEIKVGEIMNAEIVEDANKLLRLEVDLGEGELRQIVSGIRTYFEDPQELVGKKSMFVSNLAPRTIRGLESNGMIFAVSDDDGNFSLLSPLEVIPNGTKAS